MHEVNDMEVINMVGGVDNFIQSALFSRTFREGMALVEETANYLDGEGREISKTMSRSGAMAYAGSSMRLTTQLMQIASWLLVLRALREGDMSINEAQDTKYRINPRDQESLPKRNQHEDLPQALGELIERSDSLYDRISRLDLGLFASQDIDSLEQGAAAQQRALMKAFGSGEM